MSQNETAYPEALREAEQTLLSSRRTGAGDPDPDAEPVGVGLSGGGIRSATFCLGVFQALARRRLLGRIDFLSTVSGGGYFGGFLVRLFARGKSVRDVEETLTGAQEGWIVRHLREYGRYLSPNGAGDLLLGGAALFRNWVALQVVIQSFLLLLFLFAHATLSGGLEVAELLADGAEQGLAGWLTALPGAPAMVWWSAWILPAVAVLVLWALPMGWAYWLVEAAPWYFHPAVGVLLANLAGIAMIVWGPSWLGWTVFLVADLTLLYWVWPARRARRYDGPAGMLYQRHHLSVWLTRALVASGVILVFALVDTAGQTAYAAFHNAELGQSWKMWLSGLVAAVAGVSTLARRTVVRFGGKDGERPGLPVYLLATVAALALLAVNLFGVSLLSHAVVWKFDPPDVELQALGEERRVLLSQPTPDSEATLEITLSGEPAPAGREPAERSAAWRRPGGGWQVPTVALLVCLLFSFFFGRTYSFLNRSSHHALYSSRLTRAYLGASNPQRESARLSRVMPGDDVTPDEYWRKPGFTVPDQDDSPYRKGAPLHLINVTVNETVDGRSKIQQQDRKGVGMALGPCGLSAGIRHHCLVPWYQGAEVSECYPEQGYQMFPARGSRLGEVLSIGQWIAISGAAFTTGTGYRTSLGLSLLAGFYNVRLGYWWESGAGDRAGRLQKPLLQAFPVHYFILAELLARFPGTARARWYLSDGGHFENLGGYELIRRGLRRIVLIDAEADSAYTFKGLANLIRKARLDFGAEIRFLEADELDQRLGDEWRPLIGTLAELRRGRWEVDDDGAPELEEESPEGLSRSHAALAEVRYPGGGPPGVLLYLKPTLCGRESVDLVNYHRAHPSFPHEPTSDQYFDEEQWESYRKLGEAIASRLFQEAAGGEQGWTPSELLGGPIPAPRG